MKINAKNNTVIVPIEALAIVQEQLNDIEKVANKAYRHKTSLTDEEITLNRVKEIREALSLAGGFKKVYHDV